MSEAPVPLALLTLFARTKRCPRDNHISSLIPWLYSFLPIWPRSLWHWQLVQEGERKLAASEKELLETEESIATASHKQKVGYEMLNKLSDLVEEKTKIHQEVGKP